MEQKENKFAASDCICWDCQRACGGCSWSRYGEFQLVPGSEVRRTVRNEQSGRYRYQVPGVTVISCPEFLADERSKKCY